MIVLLEGNTGCGKTTIAAQAIRSLEAIGIKSMVFKTWQPNPPDFYSQDGSLCNKAFEDVVLADFLSKAKITSDVLIFDRSLISGYVYADVSRDPTIRDSYLPFYLKALETGVNGPLLIVHVHAALDRCEYRNGMRKNPKLFFDMEQEYRIYYDRIRNIIKNDKGLQGICLNELINNDQTDLSFCISELVALITGLRTACQQ